MSSDYQKLSEIYSNINKPTQEIVDENATELSGVSEGIETFGGHPVDNFVDMMPSTGNLAVDAAVYALGLLSALGAGAAVKAAYDKIAPEIRAHITQQKINAAKKQIEAAKQKLREPLK
jgi:predicted PurR-regulated permease PerM